MGAALFGRSATAASANGLSFDGRSQYARVGSVAWTSDSLNAATFTLETWFMRAGPGSPTTTGPGGVTAEVLVAKGRAQRDGSNADINYFLGISEASLLVADFEEGVGQPSPGLNHPVVGATAVTDNVWHHAAATYDGRSWKLYLDGRLDAHLTLPAPRAPRSDSVQRTAIGAALSTSGAAAGFFRGQIDEVRIWNVARSGTEIRRSRDREVLTGSGLIGRFGLDEGQGGQSANSAGRVSATRLPARSRPPWTAGFTFPLDTTPPTQPATATALGTDSGATLSWVRSGENDLAGYNLYRSTSLPVTQDGSPVNGTDLLTGTTFVDTGLVNGLTYYYSLVAVDGADNASAPSAAATATPGSIPPPADPTLIVAGDIASCWWTGDEKTATLISQRDGTVLTLGDNVYLNGSFSEFQQCFDPSWGRFKDRIRPTPGNHDYQTLGARGYFDYFNGIDVADGPAGNRNLGYYSFDLGNWHVVVLNSECEAATGLWITDGCGPLSAQATWLAADLAAAPTNNVIAAYHKPRYSSTRSHVHMQTLWKLLYEHGADLVVNGHAHNYERFAPMNGEGSIDTTFGLREIVVGTGGAPAAAFSNPLPTSEVRSSGLLGVLELTLQSDRLEWRFLAAGTADVLDAGTVIGHGVPA